MAHFKTIKPNLVSQKNGLINLSRENVNDNVDIGFVGEYKSGANNVHAGIFRDASDGLFKVFQGLQDDPFANDVVNVGGTGFGLGAFQAASVIAGNLQFVSSTISNADAASDINITATNADINLTATGGEVLLGSDPSDPSAAATKRYVDSVAQGLDVKKSVRAATVGNVSGTAAGTGVTKTITGTGAISASAAVFDGVTLVLGDRVLLKDQTDAKDNGIYTVTTAASNFVLTRSDDANTNDKVTAGLFTFVTEGSTQTDYGFVLVTNDVITLDTTALTFTQFSGAGSIAITNVGGGSAIYKTGTTYDLRTLTTDSVVNPTRHLEIVQNADTLQFNFDQSKITGTGALTSGSIASGFGTISTGNAITTTDTVTAGTLQTTGSVLTLNGSNLTFGGASGANVVSVPTGQLNAFNVSDGTNSYFSANSTGTPEVSFGVAASGPSFLGTSFAQGGNLRLSGNTLSSVDAGGNISILPDGVGEVLVKADPVSDLGVATKRYVDNVAQGLDVKESVRAKTTAALAVTASGTKVGKTLTANPSVTIASLSASFDGVTLVSGDRVLVNNQVDAKDNGIYTVTQATAPFILTRATDADTNAKVDAGMFTFITEGTNFQDTGFVLTSNDPIDVDVSNLVFVQFSSAGLISAANVGTGLGVYKNQTGTTLNFRSLLSTAGVNTTDILELVSNTDDVTFRVDQTKITATGALSAGSIVTGFGDITIAGTVTANRLTSANVYLEGATLKYTAASIVDYFDTFTVRDQSAAVALSVNTASDYVRVHRPLQLESNLSFRNTSSLLNFDTVLNVRDQDTDAYLSFSQVTKKTIIGNSNVATEIQNDLFVNGGFASKVETISGDITLDKQNIINAVASTGGIVTLTLPDPTNTNTGRHYKIAASLDGSGAKIVIDRGTSTIDLANTNVELTENGDHIHVVSHGSLGWFIY